MFRKLRLLIIIAIFASALVMVSCDEFPAFEGTYFGTVTVLLHPNDTVPETFQVYVEVTRDFKEITINYMGDYLQIVLEGEIDISGNFAASAVGTYEGAEVITTDVGEINYTLGSYISTIIETHDGVEVLRYELNLQKLFME